MHTLPSRLRADAREATHASTVNTSSDFRYVPKPGTRSRRGQTRLTLGPIGIEELRELAKRDPNLALIRGRIAMKELDRQMIEGGQLSGKSFEEAEKVLARRNDLRARRREYEAIFKDLGADSRIRNSRTEATLMRPKVRDDPAWDGYWTSEERHVAEFGWDSSTGFGRPEIKLERFPTGYSLSIRGDAAALDIDAGWGEKRMSSPHRFVLLRHLLSTARRVPLNCLRRQGHEGRAARPATNARRRGSRRAAARAGPDDSDPHEHPGDVGAPGLVGAISAAPTRAGR